MTITARSYAIDINSSKVSWTVNGVSAKNAVGATTLEVKAPALGKKLTINVTATTPEGRVVNASIIIGSGSVDLITETSGYIPPFYRGKISPIYQNTVKIIALPHIANSSGIEYDPKTLVYQWKCNDRALEDQSGYGKQTVTLVGDIVPRTYDLSVAVFPRDGSAQAEGFMQVAVEGPSVSFYIDDPLYGPLFNRAVGEILRIGSQKETSVLAVPFGFAKPSGGIGNLSYSWLINNQKHDNLSTNESVILRAPDGSSGSSDIQLDIRNPDKILQGATGGFSATFNSRSSVDTTDNASFQ